MNDFVEKYKPKKISDIIGNELQISQIKWWLTNYEKNKQEILTNKKKKKNKKIIVKIEDTETEKIYEQPNDEINKTYSKKKGDKSQHSCLMVIGEHGVGKTCTILSILDDLKYNIQNIDLSKLGKNKMILENVHKVTTGSNIFDKIESNKNKKVIVIDEIESANSPLEKAYITTLLKSNEENWFFPIIFISSGKHSPLNTTIKDNSNNIIFSQPGKNELMILLSRIGKKEKMIFENIETGYSIVESSQNDFRRLVSIIQDLKREFNKKNITLNDVVKYSSTLQKKDITIQIFKTVAQMLVKYKNINNCLKMYNKAKVLLPLMIHQNYIKTILDNHCDGEKQFQIVNEISKIIAFGDVIENYIHGDQKWNMLEMHGFLACVEPAFKINSLKMNINMECLKKSFDFPFDLNRTSIKNINKKNIVNSNQCLKNLEIKDFIFANKLVRNLLDDKKIKDIVDLFSGYNARVENIESILKIDKITKKTILTTSEKKELSKLLEQQNS
jgi:hypothetical protein